MRKTYRGDGGQVALNLILALVTVVAVLFAIEGFTRAYFYFLPTLVYRSHIEFRKSVPAPYANSKYNVPEFIDESFSLPGWKNPPGTRLVIPDDFQGKYISIKEGMRRTTDQPEKFENQVLVFGGSTVFCNEVPDPYTLPSALQRAINRKSGKAFVVKNYGATSVVASQELERLKTAPLKKGDIVVFYDGANDAYTSIYKNDPTGWIVGENKKIVYDKGVLFKTVLQIHSKYSQYSKFIDYFLSPFDYSYQPGHLKDKALVSDLTTQLKSRYHDNILEAAKFVKSKDAVFVHFLQPTIFQNTKNTWYRHQLVSNTALISRGMEPALLAGYDGLKSAVQKLAHDDGVSSFDLSEVAEKSPLESTDFLDWVHLGDHGNETMAEEVFQRLVPYLK